MEMFLLALAIVATTLLFFRGLKILNYIDHVAGIMEMIPGPTPYPFVGNLFQFGLKPDEYPKKILQYCRKYEFQGFRSLVFFQYHVMLSDPTEIQKMLSSSALLYKEHLYSFLRPWLGDGLLTSSGARWLKHHKIYQPAFEREAINGYMQVVQETGDKFIEKLSQQSTTGQEVFDVQRLVQKCTLDIACENATGIPSHSLDDQPSVIHTALHDLCDVIQERTFSIVKRFDTLFQLTPYYWQQKRALRALKGEINKIVEDRRRILQSSGDSATTTQSKRRPFLDVLLSAKIDDRPLKFREIFEELSTFMFTAHDPTASAISFTLYTLSRHPKIQQKVYEEQQQIRAKLANKDGNVVFDCDALDQMQYLELVIRETLRLYPSVPLIARTNRKSIEINDTKIAKRTTVIMCLLAMGYNEKYFPEPCVFRPERFVDVKEDEKAGIEAFKSVPFSAGPRRCVAQRFAMLELKSILSNVVRNFEVLPPKDDLPPGINDHSRKDCVPETEYDPILNIRITLKSENGIQVRLRKRQQ